MRIGGLFYNMSPRYPYGSTVKYLFSLVVKPYHPNRQLSIINSHGGSPRHYFSLGGNKGVLVAMLDFETADELKRAYAWVDAVHKGYYRVRKLLKV